MTQMFSVVSLLGMLVFFQGCAHYYTPKLQPEQVDEFQSFMKATESFECKHRIHAFHILENDIFPAYKMNSNSKLLDFRGFTWDIPEDAVLLKLTDTSSTPLFVNDTYFVVYPDGSFVLDSDDQLFIPINNRRFQALVQCHNKNKKVFEAISKEEVKALLNKR